MSVGLAKFLSRYRGRGLLLDTNILIVFVIGLCDPLLISRHKRTSQNYSPEDFELIRELIEFFQATIPFTTPQVLTEVSNLLARSGDTQTRLLFWQLANVIARLQEQLIPSSQIASHEHFATFGLTDIGILEIASMNRALVVTDDAAFASFLGRKSIDVVTFQNLRTLDDD